MSLISDALRKARQEAAERAAAGRDGMVPPIILEAEGRFGRGVLVGAAVAVLAALAGAGAVWLAVAWPPAAAPTSAPPTTAAVAELGVVDQAPAQPVVATPTAPPRPTTTASAPAPVATAMMAATPVAPSPTADPFAPETGAAAPSPTTPPAPTATSGPRDFVAEADLGYATLRLDLVVFRADDPWAQVNGRDVRVGTHVEGFVVEAIERDRVLLRDQHGPLILRVR